MFADITFTTEGVIAITGLLVALSSAIVVVFRLLMASQEARLVAQMKNQEAQLLAVVAAKDEMIEDLKKQRENYREQRENYKEMAAEATTNLEIVAREKATSRGRMHTKPLAPVVPEHNSPTTPEQAEAAELATIRARLVAATLALDLPPRVAAPMAPEEEPKPKGPVIVIAGAKGDKGDPGADKEKQP